MKPHEKQIVQLLAESARVMSLTQVSREWWSLSRWGESRCRIAMMSLVDQGWLNMQCVLSRPIFRPVSPIVNWTCGRTCPDFAATARKLHARAMTDAKWTTIVFATKRAVTLFASGPAPSIKLTQMTHDLSVTELFFHYQRNGLPAWNWLSEDRLPHDWPIRERPDALLCNTNGHFLRAVEYGGDYPASRLEALHAGLSGMRLNYEVW